MKNESIWKSYKNEETTSKLDKDIKTDVLIIGGGITGLSIAKELINSNLDVVLVERNRVGMGVTSRTTAKLTFLQENIYTKLNKYFNFETSKLYYQSQIDAINRVKDIIKTYKIDCDLEKVDSYISSVNSKKINDEDLLLKKFGVNTTLTKKDDTYYLKVDNTYVFNPIKYVDALKKIVIDNIIKVYENTKIEKIEKVDDNYICYTGNNYITCKYIVLALHYPYFLFPYLFPMKATLEKSYIGATLVKNNEKYSLISIGKPTNSIRYYQDDNKTYKLHLTNSHNIAIKYNENKNFDKINNSVNKYEWSNIDIITNDHLPFIGEIKKNMFIATGYNTWGMTNSSIAAVLIKDLILGRENKYKNLFNPKRGINVLKITSLPVIIGSNVYSFVNSKLNKKKKWYKNVRISKIDGGDVGIVTDLKGKEHIVKIKCPHLKCNLFFNEVENTWDCPCHGSRFDIDGKCINGPSNYDIIFQKKGND